VKGKSDPMLN